MHTLQIWDLLHLFGKGKGWNIWALRLEEVSKIFELNAQPLVRCIRENLKRWSNLPVSLWGRAGVLKMNILPRLIFLISSIPVYISKPWLDNINKLFSNFLWKGKKAQDEYEKTHCQEIRGASQMCICIF